MGLSNSQVADHPSMAVMDVPAHPAHGQERGQAGPISWGDSPSRGTHIHLERQLGMTQWIKAIYHY